MPYSDDKLYNEVIRKMMARLATDVKARELMPHLFCLTLSDKEEIEAKRETVGNYSAMMLLVDNLRRRENWPEHFITALRNCENWALANEIEEEYNRIKGNKTAAASAPVPAAAPDFLPASPPAPVAATLASTQPKAAIAKVTTATVHNVPKPNSPMPIPVEAAGQLTSPVLNNVPLLPKSAQVESPAFVSVPEAEVPESEHPAKKTLLVTYPHAVQNEHSVNSSATPSLSPSDGGATQFPTALEINKIPVETLKTTSPSKQPIQDTSPPGNVLGQDLQNNSSINQHMGKEESAVSSNIHTSQGTAQVSSSAANFHADTSLPPHDAEEPEEYLSKPGILREQEPLSITSVNLEISHVNPENFTTVRPVPESSPQRAENPDFYSVTSDNPRLSLSTIKHDAVSNTVAHKVPIENSFHDGSSNQNQIPERYTHGSPNEPEENHYESITPSLQDGPGTTENIVRYSEMPSIQNLNGQSPNVSGEALKSEVSMVNQVIQVRENASCTSDLSVPATTTSAVSHETELNASGQMNDPLIERRKEHASLLSRLQTDSRLIVATAVGMAAVFVVWKMNR